ncbi:MAG: glycerol-3-phosphate dehydrogenase [Rhodocyclaceae bacterium]|nr:glycerol-3-phosphate dehydrogenase [Rhodocyclaceae bacterium]
MTSSNPLRTDFDLLIVGGGINGAGIARDAAGRGVHTALVDQGDFGGATSSASTKLIHGGLRYLEHYEFRLVAESLAEREVMLRLAPQLVSPLRFVMPHVPTLRPAWMIRAGLWLYDHIGGRSSLPASGGIALHPEGFGAGLKPELKRGFVYSDTRVDDARLVILNLRSAADHGATLLPRMRLVAARREAGVWRATLESSSSGRQKEITARVIVNAAGPWVGEVVERTGGEMKNARVRLVKGSHIVVPRLHAGDHAYILQNTDQRIVFVIPYLDRWSLIGTTDVSVESADTGWEISREEVRYLLEAANRYLARPVAETDIVWSFAGIRPLYDDGTGDPAAITRDYTLKLDDREGAVELAVFGGKLTTYRKLAETVMERLAPWLKTTRGPWTAGEVLPGGDFDPARREDELRRLRVSFQNLPAELLSSLFGRHGTLAKTLLGEAKIRADLGQDFGGGLYRIEVDYLTKNEWAGSVEDILWRRTKTGLAMTPTERVAFAAWFAANTDSS